MALGLKAGVDVDAMIKAVASGSGGSTQFGIRAPWMAQRRFKPIQGAPALLFHYFDMIDDWAESTGTATPLFDRAVELYQRCADMGLAEDNDVAVMIDVCHAKSTERRIRHDWRRIVPMDECTNETRVERSTMILDEHPAETRA